ncbi:hypothetical protein BK011_08880 [Tenericutes bacterium MZ-XQ]|nr:hypothetical protein BK011_08880 [Tenericutes bacterium MZ-XQ]
MNKKILNLIIAFIALAIIIAILWLVYPYIAPNDYMPYSGHMFGGWMMPFGMIGMGIFWIIVIVFVISSLDNRKERDQEDYISKLKSRLAKGEITIEEYETLKNKLKEKM